MFRILFFLLLNIFANAEINRFTDLVGKDLDDDDVSLQKYDEKCVLLTLTKPSADLTDNQLAYLDFLKYRIPELEIISLVHPDEPMSSYELDSLFDEELDSEIDLLGKDIRGEIYNFLKRKSGTTNLLPYEKFIIEKDGSTVTKYNVYQGISQFYMQYHLERCVGFKLDILGQYIGVDLKGGYTPFRYFENKCALIYYADLNDFDNTAENLQYLINLQQNYINLNVIVFPKKQFNTRIYPNLNIDQNLFQMKQEFLRYMPEITLLKLMSPILTPLEGTSVYDFLIEKAGNPEFNIRTDMFFINKDLTVQIHRPDTEDNTNYVLYENC